MRKKTWLRLNTLKGLPSLPAVQYIGMDWVNDPSYYWEGETREESGKCVLQYTYEGCGTLVYGGKSYDIPVGKAFIYDLGKAGTSYYYPPDGKQVWSFLYCVFINCSDMVEQMNASHGPVYEFNASDLILKRLQALLEKGRTMLSASEHLGMCHEILSSMCRQAEQRYVQQGSPLARNAQELIHASASERFELGVLAEKTGVSPEHLCREFRKVFGTTPKAYHDRLRVEAICSRLIEQQTVKRVAHAFGFDDISNFNKFFKKHTGMTPGAFKKGLRAPMHDLLGR